ncbi:site-specific integrase [Peribacillus simplex]|uniref:site-specific integrase n=1 Tax=Peribacillus simplex TaxID=1478 RepID=UPI0033356727
MRRTNDLTPSEIAKLHINTKSDAIDFKTPLECFLEDCEIRNCRSQTIQYFKNELAVFYRLLREQDIEVNLNCFTSNHIKQIVIRYMKSKNCKTLTINTRLREIRAFFNFLVRERLIMKKQNPMSEIKLLKDRKCAVPQIQMMNLTFSLNSLITENLLASET